MELADLAFLATLIFIATVIYTAAGQAGASSYIAAMALFGVTPDVMKPTALTLNIAVAALSTMRLQQAGLVAWRWLVPLLAGSIPLAFVGGAIDLPDLAYRLLVGVVLLTAAGKLLFDARKTTDAAVNALQPPPLLQALLVGAAIGLLSGLTGTGGGIFLAPLVLFLGWATPRQTLGVTAPFILLNSTAGLLGNIASVRSLPEHLPALLAAALAGALLGTQLGIRWLSAKAIQRILGLVLIVASIKFLFFW